MKKLILFPLIMLFILVRGQSEFENNYFQTKYMDTFKNESVVIARKMEEFIYASYGINDYKIQAVVRIQYILKDISALNRFSTLSKFKDLKRFEIKQVKPNGKVNIIYEYFDKNYPDDGYEKDENDEEMTKIKNEEIPLEDLEIGDIIDYKYEYTFTTKTKNYKKILLKNGKYDNVSREVYNHNRYKYLMFKNKFIEDNYPIASSVILIETPKELKLIQKSINGDYQFEEKNVSGKTIYECHLDLIKPFKSQDFSYHYLHHPLIKYGLIQSNESKGALYPYQFTSANVSQEDIARLGKKMYSDKTFIPKYLFYLNTQKGYESHKEVSLDKFFKIFKKTFTKKDKTKLDKLNKLHEYLTNEDELNDKPFGDIAYAVILARFCDKLGIKYKLLAGLHKYDGNWDEIISPYEITWGLYIPNNKKDVYITNYEEESNIYQLYGSMAGVNILLIDTKSKELNFENKLYPDIPSSENVYHQSSEIVVSDDKEYEFTFTNTYSISGYLKNHISSYIRNQFDHKKLRTPYRFYGLVNSNDIYNWSEFKGITEWFKEAKRIDSSYTMYYKAYYKDQMLRFLHNDYEFNEIFIDSNRIYEDGNYPDDESIAYGFKVVFKVKGLILSGSSDTLKVLNLGNLMTEQYQIYNYNVEERFGNVYNSNLKEYKWDNTFEIPVGYQCLNLDDFNIKFENAAGVFNSTAIVKDGKIIFNVEKIYKTHFLPESQWMEMVDFLQTAEKMYLRKLLLQKI